MKRFTDTEKWSDPWFQDLPPELKLFWCYICDRCDNAGVWKPNFKLAAFTIGASIDPQAVGIAFGNRIETLPNGNWWIRKFIPFQCGELKKDCRPHQSIRTLLEQHGIPYAEGINTLQEKEKEKDREKDKDQDKEKERTCPGQNASSIQQASSGFPESKEQAIRNASIQFPDAAWVGDVWEKANGRGGRDASDVPVRNWLSHLATEQKYHRERLEKEKLKPNGHKPDFAQRRDLEDAIACHVCNRESRAFDKSQCSKEKWNEFVILTQKLETLKTV